MPNLKFSQFDTETTTTSVTGIVGYNTTANKNIQITPTNFINTTGGPYLPLAGGTMTGTTNHGDSVESRFGNSGDFIIKHTGDTYLSNTSGDLYFREQATDGDIIFQSDDGSGGETTYLTLDGGNERLKIDAPNGMLFSDNIKAKFGTGSDLQLYHNGTKSLIVNVNGDLDIQNQADDGDILFKSDNGSGGTTEYFRLDGGLVRTIFTRNTAHVDNAKAIFGSGDDLEIYHDGSGSYIADTGTGNLNVLTNTFSVKNAANSEAMLNAIQDGAVNLYYNGTGPKLSTASAGIEVTGNIDLADGDVRSIIGPTNQSLIIDAKPNQATEGLFLQINGTDILSIVQDGNVGIGTTSPAYKLAVYGSSTDSEIVASFGSANDVNEYTAIGLSGFIAGNDATKAGLALERTASFGTGKLHFLNNSTVDDSNMTLSDSRMVIDTAGNVGIGTTSPAHNLQVESSGNAEIQAQRTSGAGVLIQAQSATGVVGTNTNHRLDLKTNGTTRATISTSGNVGIGTTTPATKLHIADLSSPTIRIEDTTNNRNLQLFHDNNDSYIRSSTGSQLRFQTDGGNDRMLIDTSGNVGIGTTVPASKLHVKASNSGATTEVNGTLIVEAGSSPSIQILSANSQTQQIKFGDPEDGDAGAIIYSHADNEMNLKTNAANRLTIDSSGNVGIGTTSPGRTFDVLSTDNIAARFKSDSNKGAISVEDNDTIAYISAENNRIGFGPTSALSVNNITINTLTNNVGIGNTTPASKLVVDGGDIEIDDSASGLILRSPDGTRYRVTVANGGAISASAV